MNLLTTKCILSLPIDRGVISKVSIDNELYSDSTGLCLSIRFVNGWILRVYCSRQQNITACYLYSDCWESIADTIGSVDDSLYIAHNYKHLFPVGNLTPAELVSLSGKIVADLAGIG